MAFIAFPHPVAYTGSRAENPLVEDEKELKEIQYDDKTWAYKTYLEGRLRQAQEARDTRHAEFNNLTYLQWFERNEKLANTVIEPRPNSNEKPLSTGTVESKLTSLLSHLDNLNLVPKVYAFDRNNKQLRELGTAFTDILQVTAEHDGGDDGGDKEKRMSRQRELLKQGTAFVQESYLTKFKIRKKLKKDYKGEFKDFAGYREKLEKVFEGCNRDLLYGPNVYLGDITQFSMNDQPFAFTVETMSYDVAKTIYGQFENWKFVRAGAPRPSSTDTATTGARTIYDAKFRLNSIEKDQVEIIKYQDPHNDEWALQINGVLMTPAGFPLSAVTPNGNYNITKQILYIKNNQFAYGGSFVATGSVYELSRAADNMLSLFDLKTRKSIATPYVNITNKVIPAKVLNPGNISMGIPPNALQPIGNEGQGVTSSEFQIYKELLDAVEKSTISNVFQGQQAKSGATATEIMEVQRQAKLNLGIIIAASTLLERKIAYLRLYNIIGKWLEPVGVHTDGSNRYRNVSRDTTIEGAGKGERRVIPIDGEVPPPEVIRILSLQDEMALGMPVRRIYLSAKMLKEAEILWHIIVEAQEEETSAYHTLRFREQMGDAISLASMGAQLNIDGITDEFGAVYQKDKSKFFSSAVGNMAPAVDAGKVAGDRAAGNNMNGSGVGRAQPAVPAK